MAHAWMPEAMRIRAETDGGPLIGGAPRVVWLTLGTAPGAVSVQSAAQRLLGERRPCHLIWDPVTGDVAQLVSVLRAGRALGAVDHLDWAPGRIRAHPENVNAEGRLCVQIGVLGHPGEPFTGGTLAGVETLMSWLDSWGIPRRWPAGRPAGYRCRRAVPGRPAQPGRVGPRRPLRRIAGPRVRQRGTRRHRHQPGHRPAAAPGARARPRGPARRGSPAHPRLKTGIPGGTGMVDRCTHSGVASDPPSSYPPPGGRLAGR